MITLDVALKYGVSHQYSPGSFKLHGLATPQLGSVLGIVGNNGVGKSTVLNILSGKLTPNFGDFQTDVGLVSGNDKPAKGNSISHWDKVKNKFVADVTSACYGLSETRI